MTTYNTGNPVGSVDVKDLYDNAQNLDRLVNDRSITEYADRLGNPRKSWWGMEQDFNAFMRNSQFELPPLPYAAGLQILRSTQLVDRAGQLYRALLPATFPITLTGTWATDQLLLTPMSDASLRQDLANGGVGLGASLIARGATLVNSVTALKALLKTSPSLFALTSGYYAPGDGGNALYYLDGADSTSTDNGGTVIVATDGGRWKLAMAGRVSVKVFGAKADDSTDNTARLQAAVDYLNSQGGGELYFPGGLAYRSGKLTVYSGISLVGDGRNHSILKLRNGANTDLIYGANSDTLWGTGSSAGISGFGIRGLTVDGNRANNATAGNGIAVYGEELYFSDLWVTNTREHGIRTEWGDGETTFGMESYYENVRIDGCGKHGWLNNGPHDSFTTNLIIIDASLNTDKTYDGLRIGPRMNGRFVGVHVWNRAASFRHAYALNIETGGGGNEFIGCHFEGAWSANAGIFCSKNLFDPTCRFYSAWNGVNIYLGLTATFNRIEGLLDAPGAGRPASQGIVFGSASGDFIADNYIDITAIAQEGGNIVFTGFDGGNNRVRAKCYNTTSATYLGVPAATDDVEITVSGPGAGTGLRLNNRIQRGSTTIGPGASVTWPYPFPFAVAPIVTFSPLGPSGTITSGVWISSIGVNSVTFFNSSSVSMTLQIHAIASQT